MFQESNLLTALEGLQEAKENLQKKEKMEIIDNILLPVKKNIIALRSSKIIIVAISIVFTYWLFLLGDTNWPDKRHNFQVGYSYFGWTGSIYNVKTSAVSALAIFLYICAGAIIGYKFFLSKIIQRDYAEKYTPLLLAAGFVPGYFILIAVNRIVSLLFNNSFAQPALLGLYGLLFFYYVGSCKINISRIIGIAGVLILYFVFIVDQIQKNDAHIIGDGATFFLDIILKGDIFEGSKNFPLFSQHYDEIMFLYPIYPVLKAESAQSNILIPYLLLYSFGKMSACLSMVLVLRSIIGSTFFPIILIIYMYLGNPFLIPVSSFVLFDSGNPINNVLHISRVFGILIPFLIVILLRLRLACDNLGWQWYITLFLMSVGLSSTTVSNAYALIALFFVYALFVIKSSSFSIFNRGRLTPALVLLVLLLMAALPFMIAANETIVRQLGGLILLLSGILLFAIMVDMRVETGVESDYISKIKKMSLILLVGYGVGIIFLGNLFVHFTADKIGVFDVLDRQLKNGNLTSIPWNGSVFDIFGVNPFCSWNRHPFEHCVNTRNYIMRFGLLFSVLIIGVALVTDKIISNAKDVKLETLQIFIVAMFTMVGIFLYEYTNGMADEAVRLHRLPIWLKSRFIEPWFYISIITGMVTIYVSSKHWSKFITVWVVGALILDLMYNYGQNQVSQWVLNLKAFSQLFGTVSLW